MTYKYKCEFSSPFPVDNLLDQFEEWALGIAQEACFANSCDADTDQQELTPEQVDSITGSCCVCESYVTTEVT